MDKSSLLPDSWRDEELVVRGPVTDEELQVLVKAFSILLEIDRQINLTTNDEAQGD